MLYALLIGIDEYPAPVRPLAGCVADVRRFESFLKELFPGEELRVVRLENEHATRNNILQHFKTHLAKAKIGDPIVLYYSGHGSRERSAPEFAASNLVGSPYDETLVAYDSRSTGGLDIADKEIAVLLDQIVGQGVQCTFFLDCCHSTGLTRSAGPLIPREVASPSANSRPLSTYLDGHYSGMLKEGNLTIPQAKHTVFTACDYHQSAYELDGEGVFTEALIHCFRNTEHGGQLSRLLGAVRSRITDRLQPLGLVQTPRLERGGAGGFAGEAIPKAAAEPFGILEIFREGHRNWIMLGAADGINQTDCEGFDILNPKGEKLGRGKLDQVLPYKTSILVPAAIWAIHLRGGPDWKISTQATLLRASPIWKKSSQATSLRASPIWKRSFKTCPIRIAPWPPPQLFLFAPPQFRAKIAAVLHPKWQQKIQWVPSRQSEFYWKKESGHWSLFTSENQSCLGKRANWQEKGLMHSVLKNLLRWKTGLQIKGKGIALDWIKIQVLDQGQTFPQPRHLSYSLHPNEEKHIQVQAANASDQVLYFTLVYFSPQSAIHVFPTEVADPGSNFVTLYGKGRGEFLFLRPGEIQVLNHIRILVTNYYPDAQLLAQPSVSTLLQRWGGKFLHPEPDLGSYGEMPASLHWDFVDLEIEVKLV